MTINRKNGSRVKIHWDTPEALLASSLEELAGRVADLYAIIEAEHGEGELTEKDIDVTGAVPVEYNIKNAEGVVFFTAQIINAGPNTVYIRVNNRMAKEITLLNDENIEINFQKEKRKVEWLYFRCDSGESASLRVIGKY